MSCVNDSIQMTLYVGDEGTVVEVDCDPNDFRHCGYFRRNNNSDKSLI
jgi:hypothetical protein